MSWHGKTPDFDTIKLNGDTLANLTAEPRVAGRVVYATDEGRLYWDDGSALSEIGKGGFDAVQTKATLDALARVQGKIYYATDEDKVYTDDGTQLNELGAGGGSLPLTTKGDILGFDTAPNRFPVGADGQALKVDSSEPFGIDWATLLEVPSGGSTGQVLTKTSSGYAWQNAASGGGMQIQTTVRLTSLGNYTVPSGRFAWVSSNTSVGAIAAASGSVWGSAINAFNFDGRSRSASGVKILYISVFSN
jgi:hypothetical protein